VISHGPFYLGRIPGDGTESDGRQGCIISGTSGCIPVILGEGAVIERLRRSAGIRLDEHVVNSALIYQETGRSALKAICRQYLDIGRRYNLPLLLSTPLPGGAAKNTLS